MEIIQVAHRHPERFVVAVTVFDSEMLGRLSTGNNYFAEHAFMSGRWSFSAARHFYIGSTYDTALEFNDGTYGVCQRRYLEQALNALDQKVIP